MGRGAMKELTWALGGGKEVAFLLGEEKLVGSLQKHSAVSECTV